MNIGPVIGSLAKQSKIKQSQICRETRMSPNFLSLVVRGKRNISNEKLQQVASVLRLPVSYIYVLADDSPETNPLREMVKTHLNSRTN